MIKIIKKWIDFFQFYLKTRRESFKKFVTKNCKRIYPKFIRVFFVTNFFLNSQSDPYMDLESLEQYAGINLDDIDLSLAIDSYMNSQAGIAATMNLFKTERE